MSDEVKAAAEDVRALVDEEEKRVGHLDLDDSQLRSRYGLVDKRRKMETPGYARMTGGTSQDIAMGGAGEQRRGSASVIRGGNVYDAERDPRRRLRGGGKSG